MTPDPGTEAVAAPMERFSSVEIGWRVLLLAALVIVSIPQWISQAGVGLDPSWMIGIQLAGIKGLVYGRDFAFTYGPLGFVLGPKALGPLDLHAVLIRLAMHLAWWTSAGLLLFRVRGYAASLAFVAATAMSGIALDNEFNFALTGVVILPVLGFLLLAELDRKPAWAVPAAILAGAAMLTKFNLGVACTGALGVWSLMRLARRPERRVVLRLALLGLAYFGSMAGLFVIYGGPISALWPYLLASKELVSGYATQMTNSDPSLPGPWAPASMVVMASVGLVVSLARRSDLAPAFALMLAPMFILYKGAVIRQSIGHFLVVWPVMVSMTALVLPAASRILRARAAATAAVLAMVGWGFWYAPTTIQKVVARGPNNLAALWRLDKTRADMRAFDALLKAEQALPPQFLARIGDATVDVYPWETSYIWSNDLNWSPRPIFQAYTAYTPALDMMGVRHYRGPRAPRFVIYSHYAIDHENPCAVDSRTWIELYRWYDLVDGHGDKLLLERRSTPRWRGAEPAGEAAVGFAQSYELPRANEGLVFLKADMELSLLGKIQAMAYKVDPPLMRVEYKDGVAANYRMVWRNATGGFIASSMPRDLGAAIRLFQQGSADEVVSISFHDPSGRFKPEVKLEALKSGVGATVASAVEERAAR
ncbi:MAG: hypothetical protein BGO49_06810 [Planctomycetales bacterium 71-10]|nr:MAG: hypothetical protein BGO49_06810 [Planctomycetales bacterium 71-10]